MKRAYVDASSDDEEHRKVVPFVRKLWKLVHVSPRNTWSADGKVIIIRDMEEIAQKCALTSTLPKIASIIRQLNLHGFAKIKRGNGNEVYFKDEADDVEVFAHKFFLRDNITLLHFINRRSGVASTVYEAAPHAAVKKVSTLSKAELEKKVVDLESRLAFLERQVQSLLSPSSPTSQIMDPLPSSCFAPLKMPDFLELEELDLFSYNDCA